MDEYTVKSTYKKLERVYIGENNELFKLFWRTKAQPSTHHIAWKVIVSRIPIVENLSNRGVHAQNKLCVMCRRSNKMSDHLFITCNVAGRVWNKCNTWIGVSTVQHHQPKSYF